MGALKKLKDEVALKKAHQMASWLDDVKSKEEEFGVLQNEFNKHKGGSLGVRFGLNKKVLLILRSVHILLEVGNADTNAVETFLTNDLTFGKKRFTHANVKSFTSNFTKVIGNSSVYIGQFPNGVKIVVKMISDNDEKFINEMRALYKTSHLNVVKLYGFCFEKKMKALVFEYMPKTSLDIILFDTPSDKGIEWEKLYNITIETAKGLSYLHSGCDNQIIHCNVSASNVLLDQNFCPKITNFGVAKHLHGDVSHHTMSRITGNRSYAAPEIMQTSHITAKCDVYSFGMILFEVLGRRRNIKGRVYFPKVVWQLFEKREFEEIIKECGITEQNREKALILCMVALWCIQYTPENRPSMSTVVKMLEKEIKVSMPPTPSYPSEPYSLKPLVDVVYDFD